MKQESAVSELIGALSIAAILVALSAIVLSNLLSFYPPQILPDPRIDIYNETYSNHAIPGKLENTIHITSYGGNPLPSNAYLIKVHTKNGDYLNKTNELKIESGVNKDLLPGNVLNFTDSDFSVDTVDVIYRDPKTQSETLMFRKDLRKNPKFSGTKQIVVRIMVTNHGSSTNTGKVTIDSKIYTPGPYTDINVSANQLPLLAEGAVINNIWVANGLLTDPAIVQSDGSTISGSEGRSRFQYTQSVPDDLTILIDFRDPIVRLFNIGGDGVIQAGGETILPDMSSNGTDISREMGNLVQILLKGTNAGVIDDLKVIRGLSSTGQNVIDSGKQVTTAIGLGIFDYSLPNPTNTYTFDDESTDPDETQDFSLAVQFSGTIPTRTVRVINLGPGGIVRYDSYTVLAGTNQNLVVPQTGTNNLLVQGQTDFPIEKVTYILGNYTDENAVWGDPTHQNITAAEGQDAYNWAIPEGSGDYTVVVKYKSDLYHTVRIINQGPEGIVLANGVTINPGEVKEVFVLNNNPFSLNVTSQNGKIINTISYLDHLTNDPDQVISSGTHITGAVGSSSYNYGIPSVNNDYTFVVNFTQPQYTVRVFNEGGGTANVSGTLIPAGSYADFIVNAGENFSALFDGQTTATIGNLAQMTGIAPNSSVVFSSGTKINSAIGTSTFTQTISNIANSYSIAVKFDLIKYKIEASACIGGTIDKTGITLYNPGDTPSYTITASGLNRCYNLFIDGKSVSFPSGTRSYTYQFDPLTANHTININFAINGVRGTYWKNAVINLYNPNPGHADMTRYVVDSSTNKLIEQVPSQNVQYDDYIMFADASGMSKFRSGGSCSPGSSNPSYACPPIPYNTLDTRWPRGPYSSGSGYMPSDDNFYVNWTGLLFLEKAGSYTFWTRADDGLKFYIDGYSDPTNLFTTDARAWIKPNPPDYADYYSISTNPTKQLPGWHNYKIIMYEYGGHAEADLRYQEPGQAQNVLNSQIYRDLYYLPASCNSI